MIELREVSIAYGDAPVLERVSFRVGRGEFVGLAGSNGSGKTSLLKVVARMLLPGRGLVIVAGRDVRSYGRGELARLVAGVWQRPSLSFAYTVRQLVLLGRTPYVAPLRWETPADHRIVDEAMAETRIDHLAERPVSRLSAGELQRVFIAAALAQQAPILLLDEPTTFLDPGQAARLSALLERLQKRGSTILCASHDLPLLRRHASSVVLLRDRGVLRAGPSATVLTPSVVRTAFGIPGEHWYA